MSHKFDPRLLSRRRFLGQASCAAVGSSALFSTLFNMGMTSKLSASVLNGSVPSSDYKALVCLFLGGGNDSYNMLIPYDDYSPYAAARADLAIPKADLENTKITDSSTTTYGIHPGMPELKSLYDDGDLAFVSNVGTLLKQSMTLSDYNSGNYLPVGLFSHSDQIQQWQTSMPDVRSGRGWGGRIAEILQANGFNSGNPSVSMNVSLGGNNVFQTGSTVFPYSINSNGAVELDGYNGSSAIDAARTAAVNNQLDLQYQNLFEKTFNRKTKDARDAAGEFQNQTGQVNIGTQFPNTSLGDELKMVAKTIGAHSQLGFNRQTFFVFVGGWDHHDETLSNQAYMLPMISEAVLAFRNSLRDDLTFSGGNMLDKVTLFQCSDFGRTLTSNGKGSDHAWGGNNFVMGGAVNGGEIYGTYPSLDLSSNPLDTGRGRLIPTTSVDEYFAELGMWMGVQNNSDLEDMLPNIREFHGSGAGNHPIGFMS